MVFDELQKRSSHFSEIKKISAFIDIISYKDDRRWGLTSLPFTEDFKMFLFSFLNLNKELHWNRINFLKLNQSQQTVYISDIIIDVILIILNKLKF